MVLLSGASKGIRHGNVIIALGLHDGIGPKLGAHCPLCCRRQVSISSLKVRAAALFIVGIDMLASKRLYVLAVKDWHVKTRHTYIHTHIYMYGSGQLFACPVILIIIIIIIIIINA